VTQATLIEGIHLSKTEGRRVLLDDVSLSVRRGDIYAVVGEEGSGRTTLARTLMGLAVPTTGEARLMGKEVGPRSYRLFERVGFLPDSLPIWSSLSVLGNVERLLGLRGVLDPDASMRALGRVGLDSRAEQSASALGDDDRRLLGLAQAIAHDPELLVLDEPTRGLGGAERRTVVELLRALAVERQVTMLVCTRVADGLIELATHVGIVRAGRMVDEFDRDGLRERGREHIEIVVSDPARAALVLEERLGHTDFAVCQENLIRVYMPARRAGELNAALVDADIGVSRLAVNEGSLDALLERLASSDGDVA
jgi:ABC-type multidrug transport system ATPase subunit